MVALLIADSSRCGRSSVPPSSRETC